MTTLTAFSLLSCDIAKIFDWERSKFEVVTCSLKKMESEKGCQVPMNPSSYALALAIPVLLEKFFQIAEYA